MYLAASLDWARPSNTDLGIGIPTEKSAGGCGVPLSGLSEQIGAQCIKREIERDPKSAARCARVICSRCALRSSTSDWLKPHALRSVCSEPRRGPGAASPSSSISGGIDAATMLITASPEIFGVSLKYIGSWSVTGAGCCAAAAGPDAASPGTPSTKSKNGHRYCHLNCASHTRSCRRSQCCEPTSEERWCGKSARHVLWEPGAGDRLRRPGGMGNGALPNGPSYRAHPRPPLPGDERT